MKTLLAAVLAAASVVAGERISGEKAHAWAKDPGAMQLVHEADGSFAFSHTGLQNWAVNQSGRLPAKVGERIRVRLVTEKADGPSGSFGAGLVVYGPNLGKNIKEQSR